MLLVLLLVHSYVSAAWALLVAHRLLHCRPLLLLLLVALLLLLMPSSAFRASWT
jgi:hypothetical protein